MTHDRRPLLLASRSPRRSELLRAAGIPFVLGPAPDVDETPPEGCAPESLARGLAEAKARAVQGRVEPGLQVLAADTVVALGSEPGADLLGKPANAAAALSMLRLLRGRRHHVFSGVALAGPGYLLSEVAHAVVEVLPVDDALLAAYASSGDPLDKAGGYGLQGPAGAFVRVVVGQSDTVVGLPVAVVRRLLARARALDPGEGPAPDPR